MTNGEKMDLLFGGKEKGYGTDFFNKITTGKVNLKSTYSTKYGANKNEFIPVVNISSALCEAIEEHIKIKPECGYGLTKLNNYVAEFVTANRKVALYMESCDNIYELYVTLVENERYSNYLISSDINSCFNGAPILYLLMPLFRKSESFNLLFNRFAEIYMSCTGNDIDDQEKISEIIKTLADLTQLAREMIQYEKIQLDFMLEHVANIRFKKHEQIKIEKGGYVPKEIISGRFTLFSKGSNIQYVGHSVSNLIEKFSLRSIREYTKLEEAMVDENEKSIHGDQCPDEVTKMLYYNNRNYTLKGPAGTGKSYCARLLAHIKGLPYVSMTMHEVMTSIDLQGGYAPDAKAFPETESEKQKDYQSFIYSVTPFLEAIKYGYVIEIQEINMLEAGVMTSLNSLMNLDEGLIRLSTGEVVKRHPNCHVIATYNPNAEGGHLFNASAVNRMHQTFTIREWNKEQMATAACALRNYSNYEMAEMLAEILIRSKDYLRNQMHIECDLSIRQLDRIIDAIEKTPFDVGDIFRETVYNAVLEDPDEVEEIKMAIFDTYYVAYDKSIIK